MVKPEGEKKKKRSNIRGLAISVYRVEELKFLCSKICSISRCIFIFGLGSSFNVNNLIAQNK